MAYDFADDYLRLDPDNCLQHDLPYINTETADIMDFPKINNDQKFIIQQNDSDTSTITNTISNKNSCISTQMPPKPPTIIPSKIGINFSAQRKNVLKPCSKKAWFENKLTFKNGLTCRIKFYPTNELILSDVKKFKEAYFHIFGKKIKKEYIKHIHGFLREKFGFGEMTAFEFHSIDQYFKNYLRRMHEILGYLYLNKNTILEKCPMLQNI